MTTYKNLLAQFLQYKSISTDDQYKPEIEKTVQWLKQTLEQNKCAVEIIQGYDNPIILAAYTHNKNAPTCLIYGHYDVQPANKTDGWKIEPFEMHEDTDRIYGRGAVDNKGQILIHMATIFDLIKEQKLAYNVKFMIEGNEETGSQYITKCIEDNKNKLTCDFVLISDGEITNNTPVIELGFRGGANTTLTITTAKNDLHSGIYGGIAPSAAHELVKFLATLTDNNNKITIPHFYDDVDPITQDPLSFDSNEFEKITGTKTLKNEPDIDPSLQTGLRPTIQITGIQTGYTAQGYRNSIPAKAIAKINFRLVKSQNPQKIMQLWRKYIQKTLPEYVTWELEITDPYEGVKLDVNNKYVQSAEKILKETFGKKPIHKYSGGGLPIVTILDKILNVPQVLVPLANQDCNMHAVNENFNKHTLKKALEFSKKFFSEEQ